MMSRFEVRKAVIPAAGLGTRFLPATKASPKEMLPLVDKPLIQYAVEEAVASGIEDIIISTGPSSWRKISGTAARRSS
jgi:UTP--glucose-1-phosphate uridylyltransferase